MLLVSTTPPPVIDCGPLPAPTNGVVELGDGTEQGATAKYSCDVGYLLNGSSVRECMASGQWSLVPPSCQGMPAVLVCRVLMLETMCIALHTPFSTHHSSTLSLLSLPPLTSSSPFSHFLHSLPPPISSSHFLHSLPPLTSSSHFLHSSLCHSLPPPPTPSSTLLFSLSPSSCFPSPHVFISPSLHYSLL